MALWALGYSDAVKTLINTSYNQKRSADDLNQPLSVQAWGHDSEKRRYYLVEGDDNCSFRIYREGNPAALYNRQWITVAGSIDEAKALAEKLGKDNGQNARKLSRSILNNIANFEEKEEVCTPPRCHLCSLPGCSLSTPSPLPIACMLLKASADLSFHRNASDASTDARRRNASADRSPVSLCTRVAREESGSSTPTRMTKTSTRTRRTTADQRETLEITLLLRLALSSQLAVASRGRLLGSPPTT